MSQRLVVWIDEWQWQCCGEPFDVGSEVDWTLSDQPDRAWLTPVIGDLADDITHVEDHHDVAPGATTEVVGKIARIRAVSSTYGPNPALPHEKAVAPVPGTCKVQDLEHADRSYEPGGALEFIGYLVDLTTT